MNTAHDPILGIHAKALSLWSRRNEVLASNIANADTPNYKARDIDFATQLSTAQTKTLAVATTHQGHMSIQQSSGSSSDVLYRVPFQPSLDGNSVEADVEQAKFGENALRYQASLTFISGKVRTMRAAIAGGHQ